MHDLSALDESEALLARACALPLSIRNLIEHQALLEDVADLWSGLDLSRLGNEQLVRLEQVGHTFRQAGRRIEEFVRSPEADNQAMTNLLEYADLKEEVSPDVLYQVRGAPFFGFGDVELRIALYHRSLHTRVVGSQSYRLVLSPSWLFEMAQSPDRQRRENVLPLEQRLQIGQAVSPPSADVLEVLTALWSPQEGPYADLPELTQAASALM